MIDLDMCEDEIREVSDGDFYVVQLDNNSTRSVNIGVQLPSKVKKLTYSMSWS